jgi:hypothetical protein
MLPQSANNARSARRQYFTAGESAICFGRSVARVYTQFTAGFKDFIFGKRLLLLAIAIRRVHRKR